MPVAPAVVEDVTVDHFAQVAARGFVAAEPNYRREVLTSACTWAGGEVVGAQVYVSDHGLLADEGEVLPLRSQAEVLAWLAERLPHLSAELSHERLTDHEVRERARLAVIEAGLVTDPWQVAE